MRGNTRCGRTSRPRGLSRTQPPAAHTTVPDFECFTASSIVSKISASMGVKEDAMSKRKVPPITLSPQRAFSAGDVCSVLADMHFSVVRFRLDIKKAPTGSAWTAEDEESARKLVAAAACGADCGLPTAHTPGPGVPQHRK